MALWHASLQQANPRLGRDWHTVILSYWSGAWNCVEEWCWEVAGDPHPKEMGSTTAGWRYSWALLVYKRLLGAESSGGSAKTAGDAAVLVSHIGCHHLVSFAIFGTEPSIVKTGVCFPFQWSFKLTQISSNSLLNKSEGLFIKIRDQREEAETEADFRSQINLPIAERCHQLLTFVGATDLLGRGEKTFISVLSDRWSGTLTMYPPHHYSGLTMRNQWWLTSHWPFWEASILPMGDGMTPNTDWLMWVVWEEVRRPARQFPPTSPGWVL